jgi:DEAD/DEAH box helicase domain-containing protein
LVARDDPLDTYLVHHPDALFGQPVETTVLDPTNPYVLTPHLAAAAAELPLTDADLDVFGAGAAELIMELCGKGLLRRRPTGWYWTRPGRAADLTDLRGDGGALVRIVEADTGRVLGTVAETTSHAFVHDGAVYLHQGESYLVRRLDLADSVALVTPARVDYTTIARDTTDLRVVALSRQQTAGGSSLCLGSVDVTHRVVSYVRRRLVTGEVLGEVPLDLPERRLRTTAVWWTVDDTLLRRAEIGTAAAAGAAHAAEHASIGLLPLFATCDRWDIGGVSTARHPDTERLSVFVYDGHPGGAGFAERGYGAGMEWLRATAAAVRACNCSIGCPACVQSPKCGNGNEPLDKAGAVRLLDVVISELERVCD